MAKLSTRKVVLGLGISLDGYIARPNGPVVFLFVPKDYSMASFFASFDTAVMGRKTLDIASQNGWWVLQWVGDSDVRFLAFQTGW